MLKAVDAWLRGPVCAAAACADLFSRLAEDAWLPLTVHASRGGLAMLNLFLGGCV